MIRRWLNTKGKAWLGAKLVQAGLHLLGVRPEEAEEVEPEEVELPMPQVELNEVARRMVAEGQERKSSPPPLERTPLVGSSAWRARERAKIGR